ncbi:MAG: hypothetical protein WCP35_21445 [Verrucomicrobiota bacterium]
MVGTNIEFQIIEPLATGNPYCELKAEPAGNHGIRQTIGTVTGKTYLLVMDCKARADTGPADSVLAESAFDIRVGAGCGPDVIFTTIKTVTFANTEWTTAAATFKATSPITTIGLMPGSLVKPTYGCLVDNVKLLPVEIEPDENMSGVVGDVIKSANTASIIKHFVSPKKTTELVQDCVVLKATGVTAEQITPAHPNQIVEWDGGEAVPNEPLKRRVKRDTAAKSEVRIKLKQGGAVASEMYVWIVWADVTTTKGVANFRNAADGAYYEISTRPDEAWRFVFKIQPTSILDTTTLDRPKLSRANSKPPPGAGNPYTIRPSEVADSATRQWDVSRQYKVTIRNPGGIPKADLEWGHHVPAAWTANQPSAADTPVTYPSSDVEGNDDPLDCIDEDAEPYAPSQLLNLNHQTGELSSTDAPNTHVQDNWGAANRTYAAEINFIEFARLEIWDGERAAGQFWFRISNQIEWHHYLDATFDSVTSKWKNAASSSGTGHPKP